MGLMAKEVDLERSPNPIDRHVGLRIRLRRKELGVSQEKLADQIGLTFQQVQKYENGANRISASRLVQIADTLQVSATSFIEGLGAYAERGQDARRRSLPPGAEQLLDVYAKLAAPMRDAVVQLAKSLADGVTPSRAKRAPRVQTGNGRDSAAH